MTVQELIDRVESHGFAMAGDRSFSGFPADLAIKIPAATIAVAPAVLVPREPPVEEESIFLLNLLTDDWSKLDGMARVEMGVSTTNGILLRLQFQKI